MSNSSRLAQNKKRCQPKSSDQQTVIQYETGKASFPYFSSSGQKLAGLPRQDSFKKSNIPRNQKRVENMHSSNLWHGCLRSLLKPAARNL